MLLAHGIEGIIESIRYLFFTVVISSFLLIIIIYLMKRLNQKIEDNLCRNCGIAVPLSVKSPNYCPRCGRKLRSRNS